MPLPTKTLIQKAQTAAGIISFLTDSWNADTLSRLPKLKILANMAVGYNNIDVEAATKHKIRVTNTPGVLTDATADLTWALILAVTRKIPQAETFLRRGKFKIWQYDMFLG